MPGRDRQRLADQRQFVERLAALARTTPGALDIDSRSVRRELVVEIQLDGRLTTCARMVMPVLPRGRRSPSRPATAPPQPAAQPMNGGVQLPLDRPLGQPERLGDLAQLQPLMMPHDEDDPLALRQPRDLGFEHLAELARIGAVLGVRGLFGRVEHPLLGFLSKRRRRGRRWRRR